MISKASREGLRAAGAVLVAAMKSVAAVRTRTTAVQTHTVWDGDDLLVSAGHPAGVYGWVPIQALMFENNMRHPLFGDKKHWYNEGDYPITRITEAVGLDEAVEAFADATVPALLEELDF